MVRELVHDPFLLARKSAPATKDDLEIAQDLLDTLLAHRETCVGMAANMIGQCKRIIVFDNGGIPTLMFNPEIIKASGAYETEEGCLSLVGMRKCKRWQSIEVSYQDASFLPRRQKYSGWIAQIIQHEIDHCNGVII